MRQWQRCDLQRAQCTAFECGEWLAEIQNAGVFVEVGQAFRIRRAVDRNHQPLTPAQVQQPLSMVGVVVRLQNPAQATRRKTLGEVGQAAVDQPALVGAFDQRAARQAAQIMVGTRGSTRHALTAIDRHLSGITGAQQGQAHA